jgi:hypothetical protein
MAIMPGAVYRPIPQQYLPSDGRGRRLRKAAHNRMNVHITAGSSSPFHWFSAPGRASSEFCVLPNGVIEQYGDSDFRFEADLDGNDATHSVENVGINGPLTEPQVQANARIFRWLREQYGLKNQIARDAHPGESSHGLSWHRLGIDGNFPPLPSPLAGRRQRGGGMRYSLAIGKTCPTDAVILQIPRIFALSQPLPRLTPPTLFDPKDDDMDAERTIEALYEIYLLRKPSRRDVNSWIDHSLVHGWPAVRAAISGGPEAAGVAKLTAEARAALAADNQIEI